MMLVVTMILLESAQIKLATIFNLMFLSRWLILVTYLLDLAMILVVLSVHMGIIIWQHDSLLVIILILTLYLFWSLTILWISSIFFARRLGKLFFNLRISLMFVPTTFAYKIKLDEPVFLLSLLVFFLLFDNLPRVSLFGWDGIRGGIMEILTFFPQKIFILVWPSLSWLIFGMNLLVTDWQNVLWFSVLRLSQSDLYMDKIETQAAWPKPAMVEMFFSDFPLIFLL